MKTIVGSVLGCRPPFSLKRLKLLFGLGPLEEMDISITVRLFGPLCCQRPFFVHLLDMSDVLLRCFKSPFIGFFPFLAFD